MMLIKKQIRTVVLVALLILRLVWLNSAQAKECREYSIDGKQAIDNNQFQNAIEALDTVLKACTGQRHENDRQCAPIFKGMAYSGLNQHEKGFDCYQQAMAL